MASGSANSCTATSFRREVREAWVPHLRSRSERATAGSSIIAKRAARPGTSSPCKPPPRSPPRHGLYVQAATVSKPTQVD
jgi:hypothetical protein